MELHRAANHCEGVFLPPLVISEITRVFEGCFVLGKTKSWVTDVTLGHVEAGIVVRRIVHESVSESVSANEVDLVCVIIPVLELEIGGKHVAFTVGEIGSLNTSLNPEHNSLCSVHVRVHVEFSDCSDSASGGNATKGFGIDIHLFIEEVLDLLVELALDFSFNFSIVVGRIEVLIELDFGDLEEVSFAGILVDSSSNSHVVFSEPLWVEVELVELKHGEASLKLVCSGSFQLVRLVVVDSDLEELSAIARILLNEIAEMLIFISQHIAGGRVEASELLLSAEIENFLRVSATDLILASNSDPLTSIVLSLPVLSVLVDDSSFGDEFARNIELEHHAHLVGSVEVLSNLVANEEVLSDLVVNVFDSDSRVISLASLDLDFFDSYVSVRRSELDQVFTLDKVSLSAVCSDVSGPEDDAVVTEVRGIRRVKLGHGKAILQFVVSWELLSNVSVVVFLALSDHPGCLVKKVLLEGGAGSAGVIETCRVIVLFD